MEKKLRMTPEQVLEQATLAVRFARKHRDDIEFSPEDGSRSDPDFLCRVLEAVIKEGANTINIPDTVGYAVPSSSVNSSGSCERGWPNSGKAVWSVHCHNESRHGGGEFARRGHDRGRAPDRVHGERPGRARRQHFARGGGDGGAHSRRLLNSRRASTRARSCRPRVSCPRSPGSWCSQQGGGGANAFAHASGIHQDGVLKSRDTYEIMRAEDVGWTANKIVLASSRSQRLPPAAEGDRHRARRRGRLQQGVPALQGSRRQEGDIFDEDLQALVSDGATAAAAEHWQLVRMNQASAPASARAPRSY